jgi:multisubunit Na+/H+ antiporter MnhC subunit
LAGRENGVRLMNSGAMNLLVRIMLFVLISSKMCSVLVPLELMARGVKLLLRDVLEILV